MADDLEEFAANTVVNFLDVEQSPATVPPPPTPRIAAPMGLGGLDEDEEDQTHLSDDELRSLMGDDEDGQQPWDDEDSLSEDMGISRETLMALEQEEAKLAQPPVSQVDKTMLAVLEDAYPDVPEGEDEKSADDFATDEVDPPTFDDLPTLIAGKIPQKNVPPSPPSKAQSKKQDSIDVDFDSLLDDQHMDMEEIDLDADTYVAARDSTQLPMGLSGDEEEALSSLGFNPGLSRAEEDALGSLGFRGDADVGPLDDDDDLIPAQARNPSPPPSTTRGSTYASLKKKSFLPRPWVVVALLAIVLAGSVLYTRTGVKEWLEYKFFDMDNSFRIISLESKWIEKDYGQLLLVEGTIRNTTSLSHTVPVVKVLLLDKDNNKVAETSVIPGRILGEKDLEGTQDTLRTIIHMQGDTKRMKPPKLYPKKELTLQALFINPPENASRFQTEFEFLNKQTSRSGGTRTFQSVF